MAANKIHISSFKNTFLRYRPFEFYEGGGGGGGGAQEDVFRVRIFFIRDTILSFYLHIIQNIQVNFLCPGYLFWKN